LVKPHTPEKILPTWAVITTFFCSESVAYRRTSEMANMPTIMGNSVTPLSMSSLPKVKRGKADGLFIPTQASNSPISSDTKPFRVLAGEIKMAHDKPRTTNQKTSYEEKLRAKSASTGAATIRTNVPNKPPTNEKTMLAPKATFA